MNFFSVLVKVKRQSAFPDPVVQCTIDLDMAILDTYAKELSKVE